MPDNRDFRGERDRRRIAIEQDHEINHLREKFGVTSQKVLEAIQAVGNDREKVEEYLRGLLGGSGRLTTGGPAD